MDPAFDYERPSSRAAPGRMDMAKGVQPETASQRLGLSAAGAGGQTPQVTSTRFCSVEWTSSGPRSNLEGGLVRGGGHQQHGHPQQQSAYAIYTSFEGA
jgi:hypothetical protein